MKYVPQQFGSTRRINPGAYSQAAQNLTKAMNNLYEINRRTAPDYSKLAQTQQDINKALAIKGMEAEAKLAETGILVKGKLQKQKEVLKGEEAARKTKRAGKLMLFGGGAIMQGMKMAGRKPIKKPEPIYGVETPFKVPESPYKGRIDEFEKIGPAPVMPNPDQSAGTTESPLVMPNPDAKQSGPKVQVAPIGPSAPKTSGDQASAFQKIMTMAQKDGRAKHPGLVAGIAMHESGHLNAPNSVFMQTGGTNAFGQTGDRGWGTIPREGHSVGWTKYPDLQTGVSDHITLWHDTKNHPDNYNAHATPQAGLNAVLGSYSPNSDPSNKALGYTQSGYQNNVLKIMGSNGVL